jgi:hypothetical protein
MTLEYGKTPYGIAPQKPASLPTGMKSMNTAPTATPVTVVEPDGKRYAALHHGGRWMQVEQVFDSYSGRYRVAMNGRVIDNPVGWLSS